MNTHSRVKKIKRQLMPDDPYEDARNFVSHYMETRVYPAGLDIESEVQKLADQGMGLKELLDNIASDGPEPLRAAL